MNDSDTPTPARPLRPSPWRRVRTWLLLVLGLILFIAGGAVGGGTATLIIFNRLQHHTYNPRHNANRVTSGLKRQLHLSDAQANRIEAIFTLREGNIVQLHRQARTDVAAELRMMRNDVAKVLTPKQRQQWFALFDRMRHNWLPTDRQARHHRPQSPRSGRHSNAGHRSAAPDRRHDNASPSHRSGKTVTHPHQPKNRNTRRAKPTTQPASPPPAPQ